MSPGLILGRVILYLLFVGRTCKVLGSKRGEGIVSVGKKSPSRHLIHTQPFFSDYKVVPLTRMPSRLSSVPLMNVNVLWKLTLDLQEIGMLS